MIFRSVYHTRNAVDVLYQLLAERTPQQAISHKVMPTHEEHRQFVMSAPYLSWMLLQIELHDIIDPTARQNLRGDSYAGALYVSKREDLGIFIFKRWRRHGFGRHALEWARATFRDRQLYANINPENAASIAFFERHGASHIQNTYRL